MHPIRDIYHPSSTDYDMFGFKGLFGFSFSWKRLLGISGLKNSIARRTGVPTTMGGVERKLGRGILGLLFGRRR
jgi:hypothetical protein